VQRRRRGLRGKKREGKMGGNGDKGREEEITERKREGKDKKGGVKGRDRGFEGRIEGNQQTLNKIAVCGLVCNPSTQSLCKLLN
jgi:hypothetical protein